VVAVAAGLAVLRVPVEPVAAALVAQHKESLEQTVLVAVEVEVIPIFILRV
tara:strand:- start:50 stop:202 length:153 start_codon:yes stop_codon:yes gene_type:complete